MALVMDATDSRRHSTWKFSIDNPGNIHDSYRIQERLGAGSFGTVRRALNLKTQEECAVKSLPKVMMDRSGASKQDHARQIDREIELLKSMDHQNIIRLLDTFEDEERVFLVMEVCQGGELFDFILQSGSFAESQAVVVMKQIFCGVEYLHERNVVHRDLKPANCLFHKRAALESNCLKIVDFGLSIHSESGQALRAQNGTPYYMAPQVLKGTSYDSAADLWSCGVMLYVLLCGYPPFNGKRANEVVSKATHGNYSFNDVDWADVSQDARDLIRNLLKTNAKERLTAQRALEHRWIMTKCERAPLPDATFKQLRKFHHDCGMQRSRRPDQEAAGGVKRRPNVAEGTGSWVMQTLSSWSPSGIGFFCCSDSGRDERYLSKGAEFVEVDTHGKGQDECLGVEAEEIRPVSRPAAARPAPAAQQHGRR